MIYDIDKIKQEIKNIVSLDKIERLEFIEEDKIYIKINLEKTDNEVDIKDSIIKLMKIDFKIPKVKYEAEVLVKRHALMDANKIIVSSGKGGVGKSFVTSNLASSLESMGYKVAIIDADIYGSSIPMIFNMENSATSSGEKIYPMKYKNIEFIGTSNINPNNDPIVWRGPMLGRLLNSFFYDVLWSEDIDYLIVDLPPGTGDVPLDLNQLIPDAKSLVVTTPNTNASKVAIFAGEIAKMQKHDLLGVVENMSYYDHNGEQLPIFGKDGGKLVADTLKTDLLIKLPINPPKHENLYTETEEVFSLYNELCTTIIKKFEN